MRRQTERSMAHLWRKRRTKTEWLATTAFVFSLAAGALPSRVTEPATRSHFQPSPEIARLLRAFAGDWHVHETFEVSARHPGGVRDGTASFREGAGFSLVEDYRSKGTAGELRFLGVFWWDPSARVYRLLTCANDDGCEVRGTLRWEGDALVNSWEERERGNPVVYRDSFVAITRDSFTLLSEGLSQGKTIWRVTTRYTRRVPAPASRGARPR
jgi:hypothetical protein